MERFGGSVVLGNSEVLAVMSRLGLVTISPSSEARQTLFAGSKSAQKCLFVRWCGPGRL